MARIRFGQEIYLVDCFDGGRFVDEKSFLSGIDKASAEIIREIVRKPTSVEAIVARVLSNLMNVYDEKHEEENYQLMADLKRRMEKNLGSEEV